MNAASVATQGKIEDRTTNNFNRSNILQLPSVCSERNKNTREQDAEKQNECKYAPYPPLKHS